MPPRVIDRLETYLESLQRQQDMDRGPEGRWALGRVHGRLQQAMDALDTMVEVVGRRLVSRGYWPIQRVPTSSTVQMTMLSWARHLQSMAVEVLTEHIQQPLHHGETVPSPQFLPESASSEPTFRSPGYSEVEGSTSVEADLSNAPAASSSSSGGTESRRERSRSPQRSLHSGRDDGRGVETINLDNVYDTDGVRVEITDQLRRVLDGALCGIWAEAVGEPAQTNATSSSSSLVATRTSTTTTTLREDELSDDVSSFMQGQRGQGAFSSSLSSSWASSLGSSTTSTSTTSTRSQADVVRDVVNQALQYGGTVNIVEVIRRLLDRQRHHRHLDRLLGEALEECLAWIDHPQQALPMNAAEFERVIWEAVSLEASRGSSPGSSSALPAPDNSLAVLLQPDLPADVEAVTAALPGYSPSVVHGLRRRVWRSHLRRIGYYPDHLPRADSWIPRPLHLVQANSSVPVLNWPVDEPRPTPPHVLRNNFGMANRRRLRTRRPPPVLRPPPAEQGGSDAHPAGNGDDAAGRMGRERSRSRDGGS